MKKQKSVKRSEISLKTYIKILKANEKKKYLKDKTVIELDNGFKPLTMEEVANIIKENV